MKRYPHVARLVFDRPWALHPSYLALMAEIIELRFEGNALTAEEIEARIEAQATKNGERIGAQRAGNVSVIPVYGVISQRTSMMSEYSGGCSLDDLMAGIRDELADPAVAAVVLDIDSPGGSIDGLMEAAAELRTLAAGPKPVAGVANTMAASAAFWLLSQCTEAIVTPSGSVGSVGVYCLHWDESRQVDAEGLTPTFIFAGPHKVEGNPYEPLSEEARAALQTEVDFYYRAFIADVAKGRNATTTAVTDSFGGGRMVLPPSALAASMVDRIDTLGSTVARYQRGRVAVRGRNAADAISGAEPLAGEVDESVDEIPDEGAAATKPTPIPTPAPQRDRSRIAAGAAQFDQRIHGRPDRPWYERSSR